MEICAPQSQLLERIWQGEALHQFTLAWLLFNSKCAKKVFQFTYPAKIVETVLQNSKIVFDGRIREMEFIELDMPQLKHLQISGATKPDYSKQLMFVDSKGDRLKKEAWDLTWLHVAHQYTDNLLSHKLSHKYFQ